MEDGLLAAIATDRISTWRDLARRLDRVLANIFCHHLDQSSLSSTAIFVTRLWIPSVVQKDLAVSTEHLRRQIKATPERVPLPVHLPSTIHPTILRDHLLPRSRLCILIQGMQTSVYDSRGSVLVWRYCRTYRCAKHDMAQRGADNLSPDFVVFEVRSIGKDVQ
jgi:hypothetical protein